MGLGSSRWATAHRHASAFTAGAQGDPQPRWRASGHHHRVEGLHLGAGAAKGAHAGLDVEAALRRLHVHVDQAQGQRVASAEIAWTDRGSVNADFMSFELVYGDQHCNDGKPEIATELLSVLERFK